MKTIIKFNSRLERLEAIRTFEKYGIRYTETETGFIADIEPEKAWAIGLI